MDIHFPALRQGAITLYPITTDNMEEVLALFSGFPDSDDMIEEIKENYLPKYDEAGKCINYGFYATFNGEAAGISLLGISSWHDLRGYTGADTLLHMRGKGVAPGSKPHLFYIGFHLFGLNRIETGCFVSNIASKRSIEKTPGFQYEGTLRAHGRNDDGEFEDVYSYAILRRDWERLYNPADLEVIP